ncbi:helix-turn-helix domain-containing protein [Roseivirga sp. BDSF3-8]|uniref:helix-turn-helix domain-containing protein n=1 Tax=Roseivirga sp. BDSF3-8 TaxID=3241598 RepID=UPI0035320C67
MQTYEDSRSGAFFSLTRDYTSDFQWVSHKPYLLYIHWNRSPEPIPVNIGSVPLTLMPGQLISNTFLQEFTIAKSSALLTTFAFNREFYCIRDHDQETSCNGILFMGARTPPLITPGAEETRKLGLLLAVFEDEFGTRDNIQEEMLRMLLKRLIIKLTRLVRHQQMPHVKDMQTVDIIRKFNILVDQHFRVKHQVQDYAELLHRSPKTLSNLFAKYSLESPISIIHGRITLEAKRLLLHSSLNVKEIAYQLGFTSPGAFQHVFKKCTGHSPAAFRAAPDKQSA